MLHVALPLLSDSRAIVIGMLHAPPLPGSPGFRDLETVRRTVLADAETLVAGGITNLMLENFGDMPFFPGSVPSATVAHMTALAVQIKQMIPHGRLGVNVLRNDGCAALGIAQAAGADFIRVNVLSGARVTDQGLIQGIAAELLRLRASLAATHIAILADVDVKHSAPLAPRPLDVETRDLIERGQADAVIVSGSATGSAVDLAHLETIARAAQKTPVLVGSGVTEESLSSLLPHADGFIVGTALKRDGQVHAAVELDRVRRFMDALKTAKGAS